MLAIKSVRMIRKTILPNPGVTGFTGCSFIFYEKEG
jgi:hypothetical protein